MIKNFGGINLATKDVETLIHFYKDILELPIVNEGYGNLHRRYKKKTGESS